MSKVRWKTEECNGCQKPPTQASQPLNDLLCLRLRNAIADKEACIAAGNNDLARYGSWQVDWAEGIRDANTEIQKIIAEVKA